MERKIYNKPFMVKEQFMPQDYVAACTVFIPAANVGQAFWIDLVHSNGSGGSGYTYSKGPDDIVDEATVESCLGGAIGPANTHFHNTWYENMTVWKKTTSSSIPSGCHYSTGYNGTKYFEPIAGLSNVAIYVGRDRHIWIFNGNDGLKPDNPQFYPTVNKTYS